MLRNWVQLVTATASFTRASSRGACPTNPAVLVPTASIGREPDSTSSTYTPGLKYSGMLALLREHDDDFHLPLDVDRHVDRFVARGHDQRNGAGRRHTGDREATDRKSTRLNSSHVKISYAVFCL